MIWGFQYRWKGIRLNIKLGMVKIKIALSIHSLSVKRAIQMRIKKPADIKIGGQINKLIPNS